MWWKVIASSLQLFIYYGHHFIFYRKGMWYSGPVYNEKMIIFTSISPPDMYPRMY